MPGAGPHDEKRILDTVLFLAWHEAYHIGAIGAIRREQGRKAIAELVRSMTVRARTEEKDRAQGRETDGQSQRHSR